MNAVAQRGRRQRIYSTYLDAVEEGVVRRVAQANGIAPNGVIRYAVRKLFGLPSPTLVVPDDVQAEIAERVERSRVS